MIYVDVSAAAHSRAGLGRYSERLAQAIAQIAPGRIALFHNTGRGATLPPTLRHLPCHTLRLGYKPWRMAVWLAQLNHIPFNHLVPEAELFHSTEHLLMPLSHTPTVLTIHDLIFKRFPAYHKKLNYWFLNLAVPLFCRRATTIIAVSQASKQDLLSHYQLDPANIHVVYEAAADHFRPPSPAGISHVRQKYHLPDHFLVHLGTIEPRKNLTRLLEAFKIVRYDFPDLHLVLVGAKGWLYADFFAKIEAEGLSQVVFWPGWLPDEDLPAVIAAADLAVQPSLYEGFGLPLLEAMACGQVVAASNSSSHPEVGGAAALYFDPAGVAEMAEVIRRLLSGRDEYDHHRQLSLAQAQQFSWQRAAQETWQIYQQVLNHE